MFLVFTLFFVSGCSSENIGKVSVYEMENYTDIKEDSLKEFTKVEVVSEFKRAIEDAEQVLGIADTIAPHYKVEMSEESYFLWLNEGQGSVMNLKDTHTIYTLSKSSAKTINELLN